MNRLHLASGLSILALATVVSCGGSSSSSSGGVSAGTQMRLTEVSIGFGRVLPHTTHRWGADGNPTTEIIDLNTVDEILANVRGTNPVLPVATFPVAAILPDGAPGNQFVTMQFTRPLDINSILDPNPSGGGFSGLVGNISVVATDALSGASVQVKGRAFIDGQTYSGTPVDGQLELQQWVALDVDGNVIANPAFDNNLDGTPDGEGFPGTESSFSGDSALVGAATFTFVVDQDGNLSTHESFPAGSQLRIEISEGVLAVGGRRLVDRGLACTTVGADTIPPQPRRTPPPESRFITTPTSGAVDIDPASQITVEFSEPVQPTSVGDLPLGSPPQLSSSLSVAFGPDTSRVDVPFNVLPVSPLDLSRYQLTLAFDVPGDGPEDAPCGAFNRVDITAFANQFRDLNGNVNTLNGNASYTTGEGPGLVNAPVAPDTIYVARTGAQPGISVIDLNGFGGGTGNPVYDPTFQTFQRGWTYFPLNPNVLLQGSTLFPPLGPGACTVNGGSSGVFTLTKDSSLNDKLVRSPLILSIGDMALGQSLDTTFNNGPSPFGCQSGTGNLCAQDGLKNIVIVRGGANTIIPQPLLANNNVLQNVTGTQNIVSWAPSPNPPPLLFPPLCASPFIAGQEPTSVDSFNAGLTNQLAPGNAMGDPLNGIPPQGLLSEEQNTFFFGPSRPAGLPSACSTYMLRQQVGQFLYMIDRGAKEVVVFNSNRMTIVDRIPLPDPTEFAMGTNIDFLAVSNQSVDTVSFIDVDPKSSTFHEVVVQTVVGDAPRGIAWDGANEDILVCNEASNSLSVISCSTLNVRKTISSQLNQPFAVAMTQRQIGFGFNRQVYYGYVLNRNGNVAVFESGPNSVNGWGYDDVIGIVPLNFQNPQTIQAEPKQLNSAFWVAHEGAFDPLTDAPGEAGTPALTLMKIESGFFGAIPLNAQSLLIPNFRDMSIGVEVSLGPNTLAGIPVDIAFDNLRNYTGLTNYHSENTFSAGFPATVNGKSLARKLGNTILQSTMPSYVFVAVPNPQQGSEGLVHVINASGYSVVDTNVYEPGIQSIEVTGATVLMDYFRQ